MHRLFTFLLLFVVQFSFGQLAFERKAMQVLCSDSLFGRGYVNDGSEKAAQFIANTFEQIGAEPFFGNSYFQPFSFQVNTFPGKLEVNLGKKSLVPGVDYLVVPVSGSYSGKMNYQELDLNNITTQDGLMSAILALKSAKKNTFLIDLVAAKKKGIDTPEEALYGLGNFANVIFLTDEKFTWAVGREQVKHAMLSIQKSVFKKKKIQVEIEAVVKKSFQAKNVGAVIKSKINNAPVLVVCAHYDHLGGMGASTFFPGANDNASGTVMLFSLAKEFMHHSLPFDLVFLAFAGEEVGILGSKHFVESEIVPKEEIKFVINLDIMGSGEDGITVVNGAIHEAAFNQLVTINDSKQLLPSIKARGETKNSDHYPFHLAGVKSFFIYTRGTNKNYHDINDTYENISFAAYESILQLLKDFILTF